MKSNGVESLKREVKKMRRLKHKNIVRLNEVQETEKIVYIIMEYIEGTPIIDEKSKMPQNIDDIRKIMKALLKGIRYLGKKKIVHKDLKPSNIFFMNQDDPSSLKILDFGLAADFTDRDSLFKIAGTPGFLAPEIFKKKKEKAEIGLDSKMDIFAAGVIMYCFLFKKFPFSGKCREELYKSNKKCEIFNKNPNAIKKELKSTLAQDLLWKMLERDPKNRISVSEALNHEFFQIRINGGKIKPEKTATPTSSFLEKIMKHLFY